MPTSVAGIIKKILDALSNISTELSGYSLYFWMVLVMIMYFCTYVKEGKFMVSPAHNYWTLHLIQVSPIEQGGRCTCVYPTRTAHAWECTGNFKDLLELLSADASPEIVPKSYAALMLRLESWMMVGKWNTMTGVFKPIRSGQGCFCIRG